MYTLHCNLHANDHRYSSVFWRQGANFSSQELWCQHEKHENIFTWKSSLFAPLSNFCCLFLWPWKSDFALHPFYNNYLQEEFNLKNHEMSQKSQLWRIKNGCQSDSSIMFQKRKRARCLKITDKVSFKRASEASYFYILDKSSLKVPKRSIWRVFENL